MIKFVSDEKGRIAKIIAGRGVPYSAAQKLIRGREVKLNGKRIGEDLTCEKGDLIEIYAEESDFSPRPPSPEYADENVAVFFKREGITSEDFYASILNRFPSALAVHRLDRNTRGLTIFALNKCAEAELIAGFKNRKFEKYYLAEIFGSFEKDGDLLTAYLVKDAEKSRVFVYDTPRAGAVKIQTAYRTIKRSGDTSLLEVELITGKTHQIRAHLAHAGHPIVGDGKYGKAPQNKQKHAKTQRLTAYRLVLHFDKNSPLYYLDGKAFSLKEEFPV